MAKVEREPSAQPVTKMEFEFERRRVTKEDVRELIYREILEYHPKMLKEFLDGSEPTSFMYPRYWCLDIWPGDLVTVLHYISILEAELNICSMC